MGSSRRCPEGSCQGIMRLHKWETAQTGLFQVHNQCYETVDLDDIVRVSWRGDVYAEMELVY